MLLHHMHSELPLVHSPHAARKAHGVRHCLALWFAGKQTQERHLELPPHWLRLKRLFRVGCGPLVCHVINAVGTLHVGEKRKHRLTMYWLVKYIQTLGGENSFQRALRTDMREQANLSIRAVVLKLLTIYGTQDELQGFYNPPHHENLYLCVSGGKKEHSIH